MRLSLLLADVPRGGLDFRVVSGVRGRVLVRMKIMTCYRGISDSCLLLVLTAFWGASD